MRLIKIAMTAVVIIALAIVGCQTGSKENITVQLKFINNPQFAGIYAADALGYYADEGLSVTILPATPQDSKLGAVSAGEADFGLANAYQLFKIKSEGQPVMAIGATYQKTPIGFMSRKELNVVKPEDLIGKSVDNVASGKQLFRAMYNRLGLDTSKVNEKEHIDFDMSGVLNGDVDVTIAWMSYHPYFAEVRGIEINKIIIEDYGISLYEDMIFTSEEMIRNNPDLAERFLRATLNGWRYALQNAEEAGRISHKYNPEFPVEFHIYGIEHATPFINPGDKPIGWIDKERFEKMYEQAFDVKAFEHEFDVDEVYTTEFLQKLYTE